MVHPTSFALPPAGCTSVAPHTPQAIVVVALLKMTTSLPQSRHETLRNPLAMIFTSLVYEFEFLAALARCIVSLTCFSTAEQNVDALGWLFPTIGLGTWESSISSSDSTESALTPFQFAGSSLLHSLDSV